MSDYPYGSSDRDAANTIEGQGIIGLATTDGIGIWDVLNLAGTLRRLASAIEYGWDEDLAEVMEDVKSGLGLLPENIDDRERCDGCEQLYEPGDDSYGGYCPSCADKRYGESEGAA